MKIEMLIMMVSGAMMVNAQNVSTEEPTIIKEENGTYVISTAQIAKDVIGYKGPTPVKIRIKNNRVIGVELLPNDETPRYVQMVVDSGLTKRWNGLKVSEIETTDVDAVTGATYTSRAVKKNVKAGVKYYNENIK